MGGFLCCPHKLELFTGLFGVLFEIVSNLGICIVPDRHILSIFFCKKFFSISYYHLFASFFPILQELPLQGGSFFRHKQASRLSALQF